MKLQLTKEQEVIFAENQGLIHSAIHKFAKGGGQVGMNDYDDLFQVASMGMCKAIISHKDSKGSLSTYATTVMRNDLFRVLQSGYDMVDEASDIDDDVVRNIPGVAVNGATSGKIEDELMQSQVVGRLHELSVEYGGIAGKGVQSIIMTIDGQNSADIAKFYDVDAKTVTAWISRARKKIKEESDVLEMLY